MTAAAKFFHDDLNIEFTHTSCRIGNHIVRFIVEYKGCINILDSKQLIGSLRRNNLDFINLLRYRTDRTSTIDLRRRNHFAALLISLHGGSEQAFYLDGIRAHSS